MKLLLTDERSELDQCFSDRSMPGKEKITRVKKVYQSLMIREITLDKIGKYFSKGLQSLDHIHADEDSKKMLVSFANELLKRDF